MYGKAFISQKLIILRLCFIQYPRSIPKYPQILYGGGFWHSTYMRKRWPEFSFPGPFFWTLEDDSNLTKPLNPLNPQRAIHKLEILESFRQVMSGDVSCAFLMLYSNTSQVVSWGKIALGKSHVPVAAVWQKVQAKKKNQAALDITGPMAFQTKVMCKAVLVRVSRNAQGRLVECTFSALLEQLGMKNCRNAQDSATNIDYEGNDGNVPCQAMPSGDVPWWEHGGNRCGCQRPRLTSWPWTTTVTLDHGKIRKLWNARHR